MTKHNYTDYSKYNMTYKQIADVLSAEEGQPFTEEQVKKICQRAISKLRLSTNIQLLRDYY